MGLPAEVINAVQARRMTAGNGLHPDIVAEMFGFTSGDELVRKLAEVETPSAEIEALTDVRMLEQFGDLSSPEAIEKAADKAVAAAVLGDASKVKYIPLTGQTRFTGLASGEVDLLARYLERLLLGDKAAEPKASGLTESFLAEHGYLKN